MKKIKILALALALLMCVCAASCTGKKGSGESGISSVPKAEKNPADKYIEWLYKSAYRDKGANYVAVPKIKFDTKVADGINKEISDQFYGKKVKDVLEGTNKTQKVIVDTSYSLRGAILSVFITCQFSPDYTGDGSVYTIYYDIEKDEKIGTQQIFKDKELEYTSVVNTAKATAKASLNKEKLIKDNKIDMYGSFLDSNGSPVLVIKFVSYNYVDAERKGADWQHILYYSLKTLKLEDDPHSLVGTED